MTLMILKMIGCLALLMFGMKTMSEGLQKLTGGHLRTVLGTMTKHRLGYYRYCRYCRCAVFDCDYRHDC